MPYYLLANSVFSDVCERERNALCNEELALLDVEREAYTKLPLEEIVVEGQAMLFMVDSGATDSVIRKDEFPFVTLSGQFNSSMSASGHIVREEFTAPLCCMHDGNEFMHMFLLSDACPVNLMGRDLMCKMNASILCNNQGLNISCWDPRMLSICLSLLHVYEWAFRSEELFAEGKIRLPQTSEVIPADNMHCTAHVVETAEREWEEKWFSIKTEGLTITHICWNDSWCVALVKLTEKQEQIFDVENSVPHVSIAKNTSQPWEKAGEFAKACSEAVDWEMLSDNVQFSEQITAHRRSCVSFFIAERERVVIQKAVSVDSNSQNILPAHMTCASIDLPQEVFDNVPDHLWAKDKYDVGLIKGCEPVVITPKSDYRPCKPQYPLKREALEGIRPVFEALLEKGIIVPCPNSPVRTPIFPVQKVRDAGQPTEWRFVQDLQAVNAAVQVRAPHVPNPYTISHRYQLMASGFQCSGYFKCILQSSLSILIASFGLILHLRGIARAALFTNSALHCSLQTLVLDDDVALLQYVDDLLVAAPTQQSCTDNTIRLLTHLAEEGHKVNPKKDALMRWPGAYQDVSGQWQLRKKLYKPAVSLWDTHSCVCWFPHSVSHILFGQRTSHLSAARWLRYSCALLQMSNVTVERCTVLNPATLLPTPGEGTPHCCLSALREVCTPRPDLADTPIPKCTLTYNVDGSSSRDDRGINRMGWAVVSDFEVVKSGCLPPHNSAKVAELHALTQACQLATNQSITIYIDC
ncbi:uncharacterized protein [Paramisgurnus dabryanus]|uniref:uncharacterized protein n=1 Tax=Paramisgurnus dabryanus TaxID=90735 RepID=UPI0031F41838